MSFYRGLSNRCLWLRHKNDVREIMREYPQFKSLGSKGFVPDPWDDYCRKDLRDRSWKRHRNTQYRNKKVKQARIERSKIVYDTYWYYQGRWGYVIKSLPKKRFRVRDAYRQH